MSPVLSVHLRSRRADERPISRDLCQLPLFPTMRTPPDVTAQTEIERPA